MNLNSDLTPRTLTGFTPEKTNYKMNTKKAADICIASILCRQPAPGPGPAGSQVQIFTPPASGRPHKPAATVWHRRRRHPDGWRPYKQWLTPASPCCLVNAAKEIPVLICNYRRLYRNQFQTIAYQPTICLSEYER